MDERQKIRWLVQRHALTRVAAKQLFYEQIHDIKNSVGLGGADVWLLEDCTVEEPATGQEIGLVEP
jgi:hypothetical protein